MSAPVSGPSRLPNPFSRPVVDGPRDVRASAESIHREAFAHLVRIFDALASTAPPRLQRGPLAVRVLSQMPGSGKSHLLGRLWQALNGRATVIFLRAHQDRHAFWRRILERLVQELEQPEATDQRTLAPGDATQLDCLARHLLADLLQRGIDAGQVKTRNKDKVLHALRNGTPEAIAALRQQQTVLLRSLGGLVSLWLTQLSGAGLRLERDPVAWLKVLCGYTLRPVGDPVRLLALAWLQGKVLETAEAQQLGLDASQCRVCPPGEMSDASLNESAFQGVKDLCALSAFFRPMVFAFDQTEIYGQDDGLARAFGATVARLQDECINQLTIVTANETPWLHRVWPHFEQADQDRFDVTLQVVLKGIDRHQARELVHVKLRQAGWAESAITALCQRPWLDGLFAHETTRPLAREVEKAASQAVLEQDQLAPSLPDPDALTARLNVHQRRLSNAHRALAFDIGVLLWALNEGVSQVPGLSVRAGFQAQAKQRLQACWQWPGHTLFLIVDDSTHWSHWKAVVAEFHRLAEVERAQGRQVNGVALRHHSLSPMGEGMRKQFEQPQAQGLRVLDMPDAHMAPLYAAQALYADICQGDAGAFTIADLLACLGHVLQPVVTYVSDARWVPPLSLPPPSPSPDLHLTVTELVCACARPGWLAQWQLGQHPSPIPQGGDGVVTYGARLHVIAHRFAQWATAESTRAQAATLDTLPAIQGQLRSLGGQSLLRRLIRQGPTQ